MPGVGMSAEDKAAALRYNSSCVFLLLDVDGVSRYSLNVRPRWE